MPLERRRLLQLATAGALSLAGCLGGGGGDGDEPMDAQMTTTGTGSGDVTITMADTAFQTLKADVSPGTTVAWVNEDGFGHTVTSAQFHDMAQSWDFDAQVAAGEEATFTFEDAGLYEYYCTTHGKESMCGAVLVGDVAFGGSLPCSADGGGGGGDDGGGGGIY